MGWLQGWNYRREITINEQSGNALSNYQVKVEFGAGDPIFDHARSDAKDIRFTKDDGVTLIDFWREKWDPAGESATFWVEVPSIPASGSTVIFCYYGKPDETEDKSDGEATFEFFDDFPGTTLDSNKWTEDAVNDITHEINNYFRFKDATKSGGTYWIYDNTDTGSQHQAKWTPVSRFVVEWHSKISDTAADQMGQGYVGLVGADNAVSACAGHGDWAGTFQPSIDYMVEGSVTYETGISDGDERDWKIVRDGDNITIYANGVQKASGTSTDISKLALIAGAYGGYPFLDYVEITNLRVRKYTSPEPSVSIGGEEQGPIELAASVGVGASPSVQQSLTLSLETGVKVGSYAICGFKLPYPGLLAAVIIGDELMDARLRLADGGACDFELWLNDEDGKLARDCRPGSRIDFFVDCMTPPCTRRLIGVIEEATIRRPSRNERVLVIRGRDLWHVIASNQYVVDSYKDAEISEIVQDLVKKYAPEVDVSGVQSTGIVLDDIRFPYRTLKECLDLLASLAGYEYYVDPDLTLHFHPKGVKSSGITYTESEIKPTPEVIDDLTPVKNVVYVLGGVDLKVDQAQESTDGGYESLHDRWLAQSFTPTRSNLEQVSLYLERVGNPTEDLTGEIREDANGPAGDVVYAFTISRSYIGEAGWKPITAQANLITGRKYWIVLRKVGDAENTYRWYHDGGSTGENAYSTDGTTWTVQQDSHSFAFKTYYGLPIIYEASDDISVENYRRREVVIQDPAIRDMATARRVAKAKLEELRNVRRELPRITIAEPKAIPEPGKTVYIKMPSAGIDAEYLVKEVELRFRRGPLPEMKLTLGERRETLEAVLAEALLDLRRQKVGTTGLDKKTVLVLYKALSEETKLTDGVEATTHDTFTIGSSAIGGDDRVG